jgi:hypothetical protein
MILHYVVLIELNMDLWILLTNAFVNFLGPNDPKYRTQGLFLFVNSIDHVATNASARANLFMLGTIIIVTNHSTFPAQLRFTNQFTSVLSKDAIYRDIIFILSKISSFLQDHFSNKYN